MENHENPNNFRTPLALKTQKNIIQTLKNEKISKINLNPHINDKEKKNHEKTEINSILDDFSKTSNEEDDFSYNNYNSNFKSKMDVNNYNESMVIDKINIVNESNDEFEPQIQSKELLNSDILDYLSTMLNNEIIYVNSKDFERKEIVDKFVNEGLFFTDFE